MIRRAIGWMLLVGSPGVAATTFVLLALAVKAHYGRTPLAPAVLVAAGSLTLAGFGSATGAYLIRRPDMQRIWIPAAGFGGVAVLLSCVYVADKVLNWI